MKRNERGITLIALIVTIVVLIIIASISIATLTGENGIITSSNFAKFSTKIDEYQEELDQYVIHQAMIQDGNEDVIIYESDPEEIKKIITKMTDEDAEKYVIQENEIRYNPEEVSKKEEKWLQEIGVIAMVAVYAITFMNKGEVYKTIYSDKITFPLITPVSSEGSFSGWYYDQEATNQANQGEELVEEITLYAGYTPREKFTITYVANGSVFAEIQGNEIIYPENEPTSNLGHFAGWYYDEEGKEKAEEGSRLAENKTIYANWSDFIATYMGDGSVFQKIAGNTLKFPETNPTKDTVKFTGWYYDEACTKVANAGDVITQDTTFYPKWNSYIVNKLEGKYIYMLDYSQLTSGSSGWHYVQNETELSKLPNYTEVILSYGSSGVRNYPAWVNLGSYHSGDKLYSYQGSNRIVNTKITSWTMLDGKTPYSSYNISVNSNGEVFLGNNASSISPAWAKVEITFEDGTKDTDEFRVYVHNACFVEGTEITLADRTRKNIENVTYEDELLVWDFDNGCFATAKPLFISKGQTTTEYNYIKFEDGTELKTVVDHRIFNMELQKFTYTMDEENTPIGTTVFKEDGTTTKLIERKVVKEKVNYYNVITDYHMNLFANEILTSLRLNNLYEIKDMKFVKDNRKLTSREEFKNIPDKYFYGLRLAEQPKEINRGNDVKHTNTLEEYVERLVELEK